jgi:ribonuclease P/MRP protein subunit RPP1
MKRTFVDLHLRIDSREYAGAQRAISKAAELGYDLVGVPFAPETRENELTKLREISREEGVDLISRVDLRARSRGQLMHLLRKLRRKFEIVCVLCENKEVARQAAKDRRVDLLNFPAVDYSRRFFDWGEAELASKSLAAFEIDVKPLFTLEGVARVRFLSSLRREVSIALDFGVPVAVSSGASSGLLLRKPLELAAFAGIFGLSEVAGLDAVSVNPLQIVERNRAKLAQGFVAPGIHVIKEGEDS